MSKRGEASNVARGGNTPQHIIACQGAAVKGEYTPGGCLGTGEDRAGQVARAQRGTRGEMSANEQKRAKASKGKCEAREGGSSISYV